MTLTRRKTRFRSGSIQLEERKTGASIWIYRYWDHSGGGRRRRKAHLGTVEEFPTRADAKCAAEPYRLIANRENPEVPPPTMEALMDRYLTTKLPARTRLASRDDDVVDTVEMSQHCAQSYRSVIRRWIRPR